MPWTEHSRRIFHPCLVLFLMSASLILSKTGRDALYFQKDGLLDLPYAYLGMALLAIPFASLVLSLMEVSGVRRTRIMVALAMSSLLVGYYFIATPGGGWHMTFLFILIPVVYGVLLSSAWLLGGELLVGSTGESLASHYATLGAASIAGGAMGGLVARAFAPVLESQEMLLLGALGLLAATGVMIVAHRRFPDRNPRTGNRHGENRLMASTAEMLATLKNTYVMQMILVAMAASIVGILIEFQFYLTAAGSGNGDREYSMFFANFYMYLTLASMALQLFAMPVLQRRIGVGGSLALLPAALFGGSAVMVSRPSTLASVILRVAEGGVKSSIYRSNWEQVYLPLEPGKRDVVKLIADGLGTRLAEGITAIILLSWLEPRAANGLPGEVVVPWVILGIVGGALLWGVSTILLQNRMRQLEQPEAAAPNPVSAPPPECCPVTAALGQRIVRRTAGGEIVSS